MGRTHESTIDSPELDCYKCKEVKARDQFHKTSGINKGRGCRATQCKDCINARQRKRAREKKLEDISDRLAKGDLVIPEVKLWPPVVGGMDPDRLAEAVGDGVITLEDHVSGKRRARVES